MGIVKVLKVIDAEEEALVRFEQEVKKRGYKVYTDGEELLFEFGTTPETTEAFLEQVEEYAFDLNIDYAKVKLVYLNPETGEKDISNSVINEFAKDNDLEDISEGMPISILPYLIDYIFENESKFQSEIEMLFSESKEIEKIADDDVFIDDVSEEMESSKVSEDEEKNVQPLVFEKNQETNQEETVYSENDVVSQEEKSTNLQEQRENYPEAKNDYLLEKAIALFDSHYHSRLPSFDEVTNKELQKELLNAQFTVAKARDKGIDKIYQRLKIETKHSKQVVETQVIKQAREAHEEVINTIERNLTIDINHLFNENDLQYEKDREAYVQSQIPNLRKEYDSKHFANYQSVLTAEIDQLRERSNREIQEENKRFSEYVASIFKESDEETISSLALDDIIAEYNKVAEEQKDLLIIQAKGLKGQIGETMAKMMNERDALKKELKQIELKAETQQESVQERIDERVKKGIKEQLEQIKRETQEKLSNASKKEHELLQELETLTEVIESLKKENETLTRETLPTAHDTKIQMTENNAKQEPYQVQDKRFSIAKLVIGSVLGLAILGVGGAGVYNLAGIKNELVQENSLAKERYLSSLETEGKLDKVAKKMKEYGYNKDAIAGMYLENEDYISALKTDSSILPEFYVYLNEQEAKKQQEILKNIKDKKILGDKQMQGVNLRLAVLGNNKEEVVKLSDKADKDSAKIGISYLIKNKDFENAGNLLKTYPDEVLARELKQAKEEDTQAKIEATKKEITDIKNKIDTDSKKSSSLREELKKLTTSKDKDKDKKIQEKEKEITANDKEKDELQKKLAEKESALKSLEQ